MFLTSFALAATIQDPRGLTSAVAVDTDEQAFVAGELAALGEVTVTDTDFGTVYDVTFDGIRRFRSVPCTGKVSTQLGGTWMCRLGTSWQTKDMAFPAGIWLSFQISNAHLAMTQGLPGVQTVSGVPCRGDFTLNLDGTLGSCVLDAPRRFGASEELPAGAIVYLTPAAWLDYAEFSGPVRLGSRVYGADLALACDLLVLTFDGNGRVVTALDGGCGC